MKQFGLAVLVVMLAFGAVIAQEVEVEERKEIKVVVAGHGGDDGDFHWVSDDAGFSLDDLAVGESKTLTGSTGNDVVVTRTGDGLEFDINGKKVVVPHVGEHGSYMAFADGESLSNFDVDVHVMDEAHEAVSVSVMDGSGDAITVLSGTSLDDSVKESIRSVLISAGHDEEVRFIDGSADGNVKVIKKRVEIVQ